MEAGRNAIGLSVSTHWWNMFSSSFAFTPDNQPFNAIYDAKMQVILY